MARTDPLPPFSPPPATVAAAYDPFLDLGRLLDRLDQNLLRADSDRWRRLVTDEFQRLQARFDVAAARKLLTRVEQSALSIKVLTRRQEVQAELNRRRALVEQLQERLDDLDEEARAAAAMDRGDDEDDDEQEEDGADLDADDDILAHIARAPRRSIDTPAATEAGNGSTGGPREANGTSQPEQAERETDAASSFSTTDSAAAAKPARTRRKKANRVRIAEPGAGEHTPEAQQQQTTTTTSTTRSRKSSRRQASSSSRSPDKARSTSAQVAGDNNNDDNGDDGYDYSGAAGGTDAASSSIHSLFGPSGEDNAAGASSRGGVASEEAVLDHHRREQEALSEDILRLAQALKEKSLTTARLLEDDKEVVDRAGEGMSTTTDSLTAASRSMAVLTRMTEGKGWWGRMLLLGMVYGLMALLVLMFLFLPKVGRF